MRFTTLATLLLIAGTFWYGWAGKPRAENGETIYRQRCGGCHGLDGKAQTTIGKNLKMRDLTSPEVQNQPDAEFVRTIANGQGRMPSYRLILGEESIQAVVGYIRELGKQ